MKRELFEIWEDADDIGPFPYRAQLVGYVGHFASKPLAESFVASIKTHREREAKSVATSTETARSSRKS